MPPSLANRLLFHTTPPPPLFADKNLPPELTQELYDFIALALRAYVSPWWSKISRYDKDLLPQITHIFLVVIRALEERLQNADLPALVFVDIPTILTQHYRDYRNAAAKVSTSYANGGGKSLSILFARMQPHIAISPSEDGTGVIDPEYYRQVVDHILRACLPPEDYEPDAERIIIREVLVKVLLDDVIPRISQPWFIHKMLLDVIGQANEPIYSESTTTSSTPANNASFSLHTLIVFVLSALQAFSSLCLALIQTYKQAITTIKLVQQQSHTPPISPRAPDSMPAVLGPSTSLAVNVELSTYPSSIRHSTSLRSDSSAYSAVPPPDGSLSSKQSKSSFIQDALAMPTAPSPVAQPSNPMHPNYIYPPLLLLSEILSTPSNFSPTILLTTFSMFCSFFSLSPSTNTPSPTPNPHFLDKLLPHLLLTTVTSPSFILNSIRTAKKALFPNGYPGPPIDPTPGEQAEMKRRLLAWRGGGSFALLTPLLLGPNPSQTINTALEPLSDASNNRHLVVFLLDRILLALFPELNAGV